MEKTYKFILPQNKEVQSTKVRVENGEVIVDVEFKEKFEPKDGDILIAKHSMSTSFFIYKHTLENGIVGCYYAIQKFYDGDVQWTNGSNRYAHKENCRFATPEEKAAFLLRLEKECGKRWNAEKKCLEDIYIPKFGDIVVIENPECQDYKRDYIISIYPDKGNPKGYTSDFFDIVCIDMDGKIRINPHTPYIHGNVHLADANDRKELFDKLAKVGKRWNEETKQLEDIRWKPKNGSRYWYVNDEYEVSDEYYSKTSNFDVCNVRYNNCFRTPKAAQKVADQIKEIFKNSKAE